MAEEAKKTSKIQRCRACLKRNKIFFETAAALLLTIMAITVSIAQYYLSRDSNKLAIIQTNISRQSIEPHFVITAKQLDPEGTGVFSEDWLFIKNSGAVVTEFTERCVVFFDIEVAPRIWTKERKPYKKQVPINGYYFNSAFKSEGTATLVTLRGNGNNIKAGILDNDLLKYSQSKDMYATLQIRRYVRVRYKNLLKEDKERYFEVPLIYGAYEMEQEEGKEVFKEWETRLSEVLEFGTLTAEQLYENATKDS